jgi:hypothetical protein
VEIIFPKKRLFWSKKEEMNDNERSRFSEKHQCFQGFPYSSTWQALLAKLKEPFS